MPTTTRDTSITFSLAELARIEEERVREEEERRARAREKEGRDRREAEARRRAAEEAAAAADAEARAKRARAEAEERVRIEAREKAAADVARIEAEARVRLEASNAERAHELAVLRARTEGRDRRTLYALAVALGVAVCGGGVAVYGAHGRAEGLAAEADRLRSAQQALAQEREHAKATELAALDRRYAALVARPYAQDAGGARVEADAARGAAHEGALDADRLRALGDALDALEARLDALARIAALDRRRADLDAWAAERRRGEVTSAARMAAVRARAGGDDAAIGAYEGALDELRKALAEAGPRSGPASRQAGDATTRTCLAGDPGCGLDGKPIF